MKSLEYRLEKKPELQKFYQDTNKVDVEKGFVRILKQEELEATKLERQWYVPHHPVENPNEPGKVRRVCNAPSKFRGISLNDNLLTGPDLLQNLIGIFFTFREQNIAVTADIEAMFLQVKVPPEDCEMLRFLWRDNTKNPVRCMNMEDISAEPKVRQLAPIMLCNKLQEITHRSPHELPNSYGKTSIWMTLSSLFPAWSRLLKSTIH